MSMTVRELKDATKATLPDIVLAIVQLLEHFPEEDIVEERCPDEIYYGIRLTDAAAEGIKNYLTLRALNSAMDATETLENLVVAGLDMQRAIDDLQPCGESDCICYHHGEQHGPCGCDCPRDDHGQLIEQG